MSEHPAVASKYVDGKYYEVAGPGSLGFGRVVEVNTELPLDLPALLARLELVIQERA